jgi:L-iditol 2-dehydrogenase
MPSSTMRAAVLYGKEDLRIEDVPIPEPGPKELLLKIGAALTCGTDLKVFRRGHHATMIQLPGLFGHECAGTIARVGSEVQDFLVGDRLVIANSAPCDACYYCKRGQQNLCDDLQFLNGAYAEYLKVPERFVKKNIHRIPSHLSFEEAAMVEPLACVVHGVEETSPQSGDTVAVLGLGPIGLMFVALLKHRGLNVIGVGRHTPRLELAKELGAEVIEADQDHQWVKDLEKRRLDVVIEATGRSETWEQAVHLVRKGGVVNLFGGCQAGSTIQLDTNRIHYSQITLKSSFHHKPASIRAALDAIAGGVVKPKQFITDQKSLEELPELLSCMLKSKKVVKTCILPNSNKK